MSITLYGIPNCDQVKKARVWLDEHAIAYTFHDFKKAGINAALVKVWLKDLAWETLVNRKGTTWRALPDARKASITDIASATALMLELPSIVKRPVLCIADENGSECHAAFSAEEYQRIFKK